MKKLIAMMLIIVMAISLSSCASNLQVKIESKSMLTVSKLSDTSSGINKISKSLLDKELIKDEGIILSSATIGAEKGYRFLPPFNDSKIVLEIYQFNLDDLSAEGKSTVSSVKKDGSFNMMGISDVKAEFSKNGKYLIIYQDAKISADKPEEANVKHKNEIIDVINSVD